jgi:cell division protein FtsX
VQVFVNPDATLAETASLRTRLERSPEIASCTYLDHEQSYEHAFKVFRARGMFDAIASLRPATSPPVFVCHITHSADAEVVQHLFHRLPGVFDVTIGTWSP